MRSERRNVAIGVSTERIWASAVQVRKKHAEIQAKMMDRLLDRTRLLILESGFLDFESSTESCLLENLIVIAIFLTAITFAHLVASGAPGMEALGVPQELSVDPSGHYVYVIFAGALGLEVAGHSCDQITGARASL